MRVHNADELMSEIVAERLVQHLERAGFVVMNRSPVAEGAAIARGFDRCRRKATREQDSSCAVERRSSSKANIPFADLPSRIDMTKDLNCPLLGLFGNDDRAPSPEQVNQHEAELKKHGKTYEFHRYDGAGHGFFYWHRPLYRPEQAMDGWSKIFAFFGKYLTK